MWSLEITFSTGTGLYLAVFAAAIHVIFLDVDFFLTNVAANGFSIGDFPFAYVDFLGGNSFFIDYRTFFVQGDGLI